MILQTHDCALCINGHAPNGVLPILGPVYRTCPHLKPCPGCDNRAVFPANFTWYGDLADYLTQLSLEADLCTICLGVTDVYRPEVTT